MQIVSPLLIPSAGIIYNTTGTISKSNNLMHCNTVAFCIGKAANQYQNKVYQCPDSATAASKQHSHSCTGLAYIETMNTKATKEEWFSRLNCAAHWILQNGMSWRSVWMKIRSSYRNWSLPASSAVLTAPLCSIATSTSVKSAFPKWISCKKIATEFGCDFSFILLAAPHRIPHF